MFIPNCLALSLTETWSGVMFVTYGISICNVAWFLLLSIPTFNVDCQCSTSQQKQFASNRGKGRQRQGSPVQHHPIYLIENKLRTSILSITEHLISISKCQNEAVLYCKTKSCGLEMKCLHFGCRFEILFKLLQWNWSKPGTGNECYILYSFGT